ncbi:submandibular gland secretory Glx-rich protein CB-like [Anopheles aquasalis]|uniref:submandibular gland secretory Glx-rich protein CB-like n=1 Tax=Anopheles aquasalis TaxID=42839 RepID=UPI00215B3FC3|nr:submandibular gland secretory Glx-rich protein CB-like [Anopheles aquasalis]
MQCRFVGLLPFCLLLSLTLGGVPSVRSAPQPIDFLLGDEELQAVVKPIPAETTTAVPTTEELQHQQKIDEDEQHEEQATVDPVEDEQQTEDPYEDDYTTEEEEQEREDPVTEEPEVDEEPTTVPVADVPKDGPVKNVTEKVNPTSPSPPPSTTTLPGTSTALPPTSADGSEEDGSGSSEEQLTVNPIVAQEPEDHDSTELAQDVNDFIQDLAIEARAQSKEGSKAVNPPAPTSRVPVEPYPREVVPPMPGSSGYVPKTLASSEESNEQEQVKVNPIVEQTNGPVLTEEQYRTLVDKLNWYDQRRFTGFNQWPTNSFPQRSAGLQRDERQRLYQSHGSDSFHGHSGFHRGVWH